MDPRIGIARLPKFSHFHSSSPPSYHNKEKTQLQPFIRIDSYPILFSNVCRLIIKPLSIYQIITND